MWILLAAAGGCGGGTGDECPSGTEPSVLELARTKTRECVRSDGTRHGPVVEIDERGKQRRVGQWVDGKKVGVWRIFAKDTVLNEATYVDDDLRSMVALQEDGRPLVRAEYLGGFAHGPWTRWNRDGLVVERFYASGVRTGTWRRHGVAAETKTYDQEGTLASVNGTAVPPPATQIQLPDGTFVARAGCGLARVDAYTVEPCHDLFEAFQRCQLDPDPLKLARCHDLAFEAYLHPLPP
jgi:hypothetical protein